MKNISYEERVGDAMRMIRDNVSESEIKSKHGRIVWVDALARVAEQRRSRVSPATSDSHGHSHGEYGNCPTCSERGRFDIATPAGQPPEFAESIWFNSYINAWECWDCWLK